MTRTQAVGDYNQGVLLGCDAFGKTLRPSAQPICEPPFYSARLWPKVHHTCGGVAIDDNAAVLDLDGQRIPRLYAAGEIVGGVHGADRLGSCATTECLLFGRIAGSAASRETRLIEVDDEEEGY